MLKSTLERKDGGSGDLRSIRRQLQQVSWNFDGARSRSAFSALHFHPGRFISQLPSILISLFTEPGALILDPYCGSGTTLFEAQRLGRRAIGLDINPVSVLITRAKTLPISHKDAQEILSELFGSLIRPRGKTSSIIIPSRIQIEKWYSEGVAEGLKTLYRDVEETKGVDQKTLKLFCFSSLLIKVSRETRHWGYVCDNTTPKGQPHRNLASALQDTMRDIVAAFEERDNFLSGQPTVRSLVYASPAERLIEFVPEETIDLVVTSPPYFGVVDYVKSQRLSFEWLDLDLESYRKLETGARSKRHRQAADVEFVSELRDGLRSIKTALKANRFCAILFGASNARAFESRKIIEIGESVGLEPIFDLGRDISVQRRQKPSLLNEELYVFRKPPVNNPE